jgi:hypothetical protein
MRPSTHLVIGENIKCLLDPALEVKRTGESVGQSKIDETTKKAVDKAWQTRETAGYNFCYGDSSVI